MAQLLDEEHLGLILCWCRCGSHIHGEEALLEFPKLASVRKVGECRVGVLGDDFWLVA